MALLPWRQIDRDLRVPLSLPRKIIRTSLEGGRRLYQARDIQRFAGRTPERPEALRLLALLRDDARPEFAGFLKKIHACRSPRRRSSSR